MAYNTELEKKLERIARQWQDMEKKKMFGGLCYLVNGNMGFGIYQDFLIVRMDKSLAEAKLQAENVRQFDITGKVMKGWLMVPESGWSNDNELARWLDIGRQFALSLPAK